MNDLITQAIATTDNEDAAVASQLITLKPEKYVAEVFAPFKKSLAKAIKECATIKYDITTTAGMEVAIKARAMFRTIRLNSEKTRKERKAPITEIGKLLDSKANELKAEIVPHEDKYDADIQAEVTRKEVEKQRKIDEERARVEKIENLIQNIRNVPLTLADASAALIREQSNAWSETLLDPDVYQEQIEDAINAVNGTIIELGKLHQRAVEREAAEAKAESDRKELERLRLESEQREREAAQARKDEAERQQKIADAYEVEMKAMREQLAANNEAMARMAQEKAALEALNAPMVEDPDFKEVEVGKPSPLNPVPAYQFPTKVAAIPVAGFTSTFVPPSLRLGQIGERLGFALTAEFLRTLGFEPAGRDKSAILYHDSDFPVICNALVSHINQVQAQQAA